jgi:hypothetical protein
VVRQRLGRDAEPGIGWMHDAGEASAKVATSYAKLLDVDSSGGRAQEDVLENVELGLAAQGIALSSVRSVRSLQRQRVGLVGLWWSIRRWF